MASRNLIGQRVRLARHRTMPRTTQQDLAARLQVLGLRIDRAAVSKIETGYREVTDVEAAAIARTLGVTIDWLFGEDTDVSAREERRL
jgi:HTH-type transcriptional regulator, cell division transcriptional repressor